MTALVIVVIITTIRRSLNDVMFAVNSTLMITVHDHFKTLQIGYYTNKINHLQQEGPGMRLVKSYKL